MSFKIFGNFVVTGHRGPFEPLRKLWPQPKDNDPNAPTAKNEMLTPRTGGGRKPTGFSIRRVTDFTALKSVAEVDAALRDPSKVQALPSLGHATRWAQAAIATRLAEARRAAEGAGVPMKPVLILVGEDHLSPVSTVVGLTAIASAREEADAHPPQGRRPDGTRARPRLLVEADESELRFIGEPKTSLMNRKVGAHLAPDDLSSRAIGFVRYRHDDEALTMTNHLLVKYHMGRAAGLAVDTLEKDKTPDTYLDQREAVMRARLQAALDLAGGAPVVVMVGAIHLAALHDAFKSKTTCVALADVPTRLRELDTLYRKRMGYALSNPDVQPFRGTPEAQAEDFDFVKSGRELGIDLPRHLQSQSAGSASAGASSRP